MNERIKELISEVTSLGYGEDGEDLTPVLVGSGIEKFAELIVKECCEVAHCNFHVDGLTLGGILREHFGVE